MQRGFSLVELSIVLVILGLLTGGILAGQSLIRAAELRSISTQEQRYVAALHGFRDKYFGLAGDITNATSFWGDQATGTGSCASAATADGTPGTCNGDGSGYISNPSNDGEFFRSWQQLAMAGLIEGSYSGVAGSGAPYEHVPGTNVPTTRLGSNTGWEIKGLPNLTGSSVNFDGSYGNALFVGAFAAAQQPLNPILKPEEAWNIDSKMDDGKPGTGSVLTFKNTSSYSPGCASTDVASTAVYVLTTSTITCALVFKTGF